MEAAAWRPGGPADDRAVDLQAAAERRRSVGEADQAVTVAIGAADPVVAHLDVEHAVARVRRDLGGWTPARAWRRWSAPPPR